MTEEWKAIVGLEGKYEVSNFGRIRSLDRVSYSSKGRYFISHKGKIITLHRDRNKYLKATFYDLGGNKKILPIHRLVAIAFIPNPENKSSVNHIDYNKLNNISTNLEWCTQKENVDHSKWYYGRGEDNPPAKLTNEQVLEIRAKYIPRVYTIRMLAKEYNICSSGVVRILQRKLWSHI